MRYKDKISWFIELEKEGETIPALDKEPEIYPSLVEHWRCFNTLNTSRQMGFSSGYIKYSDIILYMNELKMIGVENRIEFLEKVQTIDNLYMSEKDKQNPKRPKK